MSSCLLSYSTLRLSCFEAITRGKMPKSIIVFDPNVTSFYLRLALDPPSYPKFYFASNSRIKESVLSKYYLQLDKYQMFQIENDRSEKELTICYGFDSNISIYCIDCLEFVENQFSKTIKFCKLCLNCGICYKCLPKSTTEFVCHFCDLEKTEVLKSFLPIFGIDSEYTIPELLIPKDFEILDINFFNNFYKDIRNTSDDIETSFKFTEDQKILIKNEKSILHLQNNLSKIYEANNFSLSIKLYFTLTALAIANLRHLVIIKCTSSYEDDIDLRFLKFTPFASNLLIFNGKRSDSIDVFSKTPRDTFCVLFITVKDIVGIDLQNADAIINLTNSGLLDTNQISGRLMRLGMDYRTRIIINFKILMINLLSI